MKKQLLFLLVLFFLLSGINMTYANTNTWQGGSSGDWDVASNWSNGIPNSADDIVFNSTANVSLTIVASRIVKSLTLNNSGTVVTLTQTNLSDLFQVTGTVNVNPSTTLGFVNAHSLLIRTLTQNGTFSFNNSIATLGQGATGGSAVTTLSGAAKLTMQLNFSNAGTFNLISGSTLYLDNFGGFTSAFTNSGTFTMTNATIEVFYAGDSFSNNGTMTITGTSTVNVDDVTGAFSNTSTLTATNATFNLNGQGGNLTQGSLLENTGVGIINSTNCIYNITKSSTNSAIINDYGATFNDNGSTFNLRGTVSGSSGQYNIYNGGKFYALNGSQFILGSSSNSPSAIYNGGTTFYTTVASSVDTAFFVLGSKSQINASANYSLVLNNYPNIDPLHTVTGVFILQSDANNSAFTVGNPYNPKPGFPSTFLGKYYVQRYLTGNNSANYRGYRLISSPVNPDSVIFATTNRTDFSWLNKNWKSGAYPGTVYNGMYTAGPGVGFTTANYNSSLYLYNEALNPTYVNTFYAGKYPLVTDVNSSGINLAWKSIASGSLVTGSNRIPVGNGLLIYYIGSTARSNVSAATPPDNSTITYFGYLNQGNITVYPWFTPLVATLSYSSTVSQGVNLVGNPYAAMIDLTVVASQNPGINTFYELTDGNGTQTNSNYVYSPITWNGNNITTGGVMGYSQYIASGQGFFVLPDQAGRALVFTEAQKVYNTALDPASGILVTNPDKKLFSSKQISASSGHDFAGLHLILSKDSTNFHETGIYFGKVYSDKLDKLDAPELDATSVKTVLYSFTSDGAKVAINGLGTYTEGKSVKLFVKGVDDGIYTLKLSDVINIDPTIASIKLIDNYKADTTTLTTSSSYSFDILNADTNSFGANRFVLAVQKRSLPPYQLVAFTAAKVKSNIAVNWQTANEGNYTGFGVQKLDLASNKFITIDTLQSTGKGNYLFNDPSAVTGNNTYRLAQNNINGVVSYSAPVTVKYGLLSLPKSLNIFPNPVKDNAVFDFSGIATNENTTYEVNVYNSLGVLILQKTATTNFLSTDMSSLRAGIYVVQVKSNNGSVLAKSTFIKN